jgi:hypothetical protein
MSLKLNTASGGSITLQEADTASNLTATLPASTGTVMVSGNMPAFSAYRDSNQTISSSTWTKVQLNTELFDSNSNFDSSTNYRFTPTVAGYYQINAQLRVRGGSGNNKILAIYKNGSVLIAMDYFSVGTIEYLPMSISQVMYFNGSTDYIELYAFSEGSNTTIMGNSTVIYTALNGSMVRAA